MAIRVFDTHTRLVRFPFFVFGSFFLNLRGSLVSVCQLSMFLGKCEGVDLVIIISCRTRLLVRAPYAASTTNPCTNPSGVSLTLVTKNYYVS